MSFNVNLYNFTKKYNSTAQPTGSGTQYSCVIKEPSGILNPTIALDMGLTSSPASYNYAYISAFNRYYYIREWNFERGLWLAELEADVLATYKTTIGAASLYMLRASNEKDGTIVDNLYPCKTGCDFVTTSVTSPYDSTGCYVIGVVNKAGMYGSISYYALTRGNMATLLNSLITDIVTISNGFSISDASLELQRSIVDPVQYIKSAVWLPVPVSNITSDQTETDLNIFNWDVTGVTAYRVSNPSIILRNTIALTNHPDYSARGSYVNSKPYTLATLFMPPFGVIELDTSVTCNAASINADIYLDANTGEGNLVISANGIVLNKVDAKVGVPIQIAQVSRDYLGAVTGVASSIGGIVGDFAKGGAAGITGGICSSIAAVGNAINSISPRSNTIGSSGNFSVLTAKNPELDLQFFRPVDDDNTHNGRPLCAIRTVSTLGGYMLVQDGDVPINGTKQEAEEIQRFLESGFYYE